MRLAVLSSLLNLFFDWSIRSFCTASKVAVCLTRKIIRQKYPFYRPSIRFIPPPKNSLPRVQILKPPSHFRRRLQFDFPYYENLPAPPGRFFFVHYNKVSGKLAGIQQKNLAREKTVLALKSERKSQAGHYR